MAMRYLPVLDSIQSVTSVSTLLRAGLADVECEVDLFHGLAQLEELCRLRKRR